MTTLYRMSLLVFLATCLGIGIFRFSYTALMPIMIVQYGWTHDFASFLGSANLLGYLLGALLALFSIKEKSIPTLIISSALAGSLSLICCAFIHMPLAWFVFWRTLSGIAGGLLMILAPSFAMRRIAISQRLKVNFLGFSGIGVGVLSATVIIPALKNMPVQYVWGIFAALSIIGSLVLFQLLKHQSTESVQAANQAPQNSKHSRLGLVIIIAYMCSAFAYIPHSLFWMDYLSGTLHFPLEQRNLFWVLYGVGSCIGAFVAYCLSRLTGYLQAIKWLYGFYCLAVALPFFSHATALLALSSFLTGLLTPATVFISSYSLLHIYEQRYQKVWSLATIGFASTQLLGGVVISTLHHLHWSYAHLFLLGGIVLLFAVCLLIPLRPSFTSTFRETKS
ncbi:YbfB/YjiJ family MFS transporter [Acinetobacter sp. V117_2]|uniref:YbfB/YjiJ family MFS transporter n=1 Tax=Acinetobacter sp. V117_2 TaxID=3072989 RepID=UPI00287F28C1|nr:YbfB/YjiJ family MFS transporter [Acinetobacter sp. V117_2]MDS7966424.1 YbfB/YjiJ family MFS transporter [Acinetobacter sp. V117_2]